MKYLMIIFMLVFPQTIFAVQPYKMPPSSSTTSHPPVISDEEMEQCVKIYNQVEWLHKELSNTYVNQYSPREVNTYNAKVKKVNSLNDWFNQNCAGKQSYSACKAAQKLNREQGLPDYPCE